MSVPLVSVVMATYNMGQYVREAVDSVLAQDWPALELIVVDDGSTDLTWEALDTYTRDHRVKVIRQPNAGQTAAKNAALRAARGEYVGFCDADNAWLPGKLGLQVPCLQKNSSAGVVYGDILLMDASGQPLPASNMKRYGGRVTSRLIVDNFVTFNTAIVPRKVLDEFNGFDPSLRMGIDYDLWLRISTRYEFIYMPEPLARYRIWGGQMSTRTGERLETYFRLLARFLERYPGAVSSSDVRRAYAHTYVTRSRWHVSRGDVRAAWRDVASAFRLKPFDARLWRTAIRMFVRGNSV